MRQWIYSAPLFIAALTAAPGCSGELGDPGENGVQGPSGPAGPKGATGATGPVGPVGPGAGATGATGPIGPAGDKGDKGDQGLKGDKGDQGLKGDKGDTGLKGDMGTMGLKGETGAKGDKGDKGDPAVVDVLGFDASSFAPNLAANTGTIPNLCRTTAYTAGQSEVAIIHMDGSVLPTVVANAVVYLSVAKSQGGGAFTEISTQSVESMNDGVASTSVTKHYDLTSGVSYVFGARFESSSAVNLTKSSCHGTVTIARVP